MNGGPADSSSAARVVSAADGETVALAAAALQRGAVVALPTDTVYGIAAHLRRPDAIERLYSIKGRPANKAIPILLADASGINLVAEELPPPARILAGCFWPGGLTLVVPGRPGLPQPVTSSDERGRTTVAIRVPDCAVTRAVIAGVGGALAVTSANASGEPPALAAAPLTDLGLLPSDLIVDGGPTPGNKPSTIVAVAGKDITILREGAIAIGEIERALAGVAPARVQRGAV